MGLIYLERVPGEVEGGESFKAHYQWDAVKRIGATFNSELLSIQMQMRVPDREIGGFWFVRLGFLAVGRYLVWVPFRFLLWEPIRKALGRFMHFRS